MGRSGSESLKEERLITEVTNQITPTQPELNTGSEDADRARFVRAQMPTAGLFAGHDWRVSPAPFSLGPEIAKDLETLGRVLLQFYRAVNLLYRKSVEGKQPEWVARWLDKGKPAELIELQRSPALKNEMPRVIRPDLLITDQGLSVTELDSVPGGIGLTAWLNQTYSKAGSKVLGGPDGMLRGFAGIFGDAPKVHIVVSEEAATYRPEMVWVAEQINRISETPGETDTPRPHSDPQTVDGHISKEAFDGSGHKRFGVQDARSEVFADGDAVYRFFELFDTGNVPNSKKIFELAAHKRIRLTPPPKPIFEEKMLFALLWNRNLQGFWRQELGDGFLHRLQRMVPYTWMVDPAPLPPQGTFPELNLTDWHQLSALSHKERELILKVSGFSEQAWGARGVYLGSDLPHADWAAAVNKAISSFSTSPFVLQRYHKPALVESRWFDFEHAQVVPMKGRVRLCPYYFVTGEAETARANLGGVLATICPADKKIIHGMTDAIFAPCSA